MCGRVTRRPLLLGWLAAAVPALWTAHLVHHDAVDLPLHDSWDLVPLLATRADGTLRVADVLVVDDDGDAPGCRRDPHRLGRDRLVAVAQLLAASRTGRAWPFVARLVAALVVGGAVHGQVVAWREGIVRFPGRRTLLRTPVRCLAHLASASDTCRRVLHPDPSRVRERAATLARLRLGPFARLR